MSVPEGRGRRLTAVLLGAAAPALVAGGLLLAGGVGGARFVRGLRAACARRWPAMGADGAPRASADGEGAATSADVTVVVNTGDDLWLAGVRLMPDFDSLLYALAGVSDTERGWGRAGETERVAAELREWGVGWPWFTLGDLDLGTHLARTSWLREGLAPSQVGERLQRRRELARVAPELHQLVRGAPEDQCVRLPDHLGRVHVHLLVRFERGVAAAAVEGDVDRVTQLTHSPSVTGSVSCPPPRCDSRRRPRTTSSPPGSRNCRQNSS